MNNKRHKSELKKALNNVVLEPFDYLKNISDVLLFNEVTDEVNETCREVEKIAWNCVYCQRPILINMMEFSTLKQVDYLCDGCKDNILTDAILLGILKSSNNLRILLQTRLYKNYDKKTILS